MRTLTWALMALFVTITASPVLAQQKEWPLTGNDSIAYLASHGVSIAGGYQSQILCEAKKVIPSRGMSPYTACWVPAGGNGPSLWLVWRGANPAEPYHKGLVDRLVYYDRTGGPEYRWAKPRSLNEEGTTCTAPFSFPVQGPRGLLVTSRIDCIYRDGRFDSWSSKSNFLLATFPVWPEYSLTVTARGVGLFTEKWQLENALLAMLASITVLPVPGS